MCGNRNERLCHFGEMADLTLERRVMFSRSKTAAALYEDTYLSWIKEIDTCVRGHELGS